MAVKTKSEKLNYALDQLGPVWEWLRKRPEYQRDFNNQMTIEDALKKYGFFPLVNPKEDCNVNLFQALRITGEDSEPYLQSEEPYLTDSTDKAGPLKMRVTFNPLLPLEILKREFVDEIKYARKTILLNFNPKLNAIYKKFYPKYNARSYDDFDLKYKIFFLRNLLLTDKKIKKLLLSETPADWSSERREAFRKKIASAL